MLKKILRTGEIKAWNAYKQYKRENPEFTYLLWECTMRCNFFCKHCGSSAEAGPYEGELGTEEAKSFFTQLSKDFDASKITIAITGGEPLARNDIYEIAAHIAGLGFKTGIVTNGYLLNQAGAKKIKEAGVRAVSLSLDGLEETHDRLRGVKGSFRKVMEAIKFLKELDFLDVLEPITTVSRENIHELDELYEEIKDTGINYWRLMEVSEIGRAEENKELLIGGDELKKLLYFIKEKRAELKKEKRKLDIFYGCAGFLGIEWEKDVRPYPFFCIAGIKAASILYNGDIFVCPDVPRVPELIQGNIRRDNFKEVWENKFEFFRDPENFKQDKCADCLCWSDCGGGGAHLWDYKNNKPKKCHQELLGCR
jgi:radical SAM protein with 4Fe4S-binding SPASM domain